MLQLWVNLEMIDKGCFKEGKSEKKITCYLPTSRLILMVFQKAYKETVDGKKLSLYVFVQTWTDFSWQKEGCESSYF